MEMEENQTFFHGTYSNLTSCSIGCKILKYFSDVCNWHQFCCKSEHKQVKWNKIEQGTCKSNSIYPYLQSSILFKWLLQFI